MKCKKLVALLSLTAMLVQLAACTSSPDTSASDTTTTPASTSAEISTEAPPPAKQGLLYDTTDAEIEALGLDGYTFHIFQRTNSSMWMVHDLRADDITGDVFNDAIYDRYHAITDRFGFTMEMTYSAGNHAAEFSTYVNAGDDTYDIAFPSAQQCPSFSQQGILMNLHDLDYFDLEHGWTKMFCDELDWQGKLFFALGDMSTNAYRSIRIFLFNKQMHEEYRLDDIYQIVRDGKWTLETWDGMAKTVADDLNGDGRMTVNDDRWGMAWQSAISGYTLFYGCDERLTIKGEDGIPEFTLGRERTQTVFDKIKSIITDSETYYLGSDSEVPACFKEGRSLFYTGVLNVTEQLRDSETDFGIIPTPKYDEKQEQHIQYVDSWCPSPVVVPINAKNLSRSGFLIQLLAETGAEYTKPAYYEIVLTSKYVRDPDSIEMLDIIVNNFRLDNAVLYNWVGCSNRVLGAFTDSTGLSSLVASLATPMKKSIEATAKKYDSLG